MNKKLFELKKELRQIKYMMINSNKYSDRHGLYRKCFMDYAWGIYSSYTIIDSFGNCYFITPETTEFPSIDFTKIIYINAEIESRCWKKNDKIYKTNFRYNNYDSVNGCYCSYDYNNYVSNIFAKFNVKDVY